MKTYAPEQPCAARVAKLVQDLLAQKRLPPVEPSQSLASVGFKSVDMFNLMLAVEEAVDITSPQTEMTPANINSIASICNVVEKLV